MCWWEKGADLRWVEGAAQTISRCKEFWALFLWLFRDLLVVIDWLETHIVLAESPGRLWPKAIRTSWARLFAWAGRVRYAWRPAATRTMVRETVAAARQPTRIDGAIPSFC